jgi:hypothetical protein
MKDNESAWASLIETAIDSKPEPEVPAFLYPRMVKQLFPKPLSRAMQWFVAILLIVSPPLFGYLSDSVYPGGTPDPGIVYTLYGILSLLWVLPVAGGIFHRSGTSLVALSMQIDEIIKHPIRGIRTWSGVSK